MLSFLSGPFVNNNLKPKNSPLNYAQLIINICLYIITKVKVPVVKLILAEKLKPATITPSERTVATQQGVINEKHFYGN